MEICQFVGNKAKGRISKRVFQESKARHNFRKTKISYTLIRTRMYAYQEVRNVCCSGNFGMLCFLETPVLRFALLPYYRRSDAMQKIKKNAGFYLFGVWTEKGSIQATACTIQYSCLPYTKIYKPDCPTFFKLATALCCKILAIF